ncbi:MAG: hypothetical protein JNJ90_18055 [Saprospiraceae bacterium]|jgi:type II secretory pathway pseudopilin PulG|nr:hypothetical protein [Saprospiraceae bacterium]
MNKKFLFVGIAAGAAFAIFSAFGGQTLEQQKQEIAAAITVQLDEFRAQKQQECTDRVNAEAQVRYDAYVASLPPAKAEKPGAPKKSTPKKAATTPSKTPMPQTPPQPATQPSQSKWNQNNPEGVQESKSKWQSGDPAKKDAATPPPAVQESKSKWDKKPAGGGK